jgi:hypothetical protein
MYSNFKVSSILIVEFDWHWIIMLLGCRNESTKNDEYLNHNSDAPQGLGFQCNILISST